MREETYCGKEEIYVSSCSVIELDCPSPATITDGSDSGIYNGSTDTGVGEKLGGNTAVFYASNMR